MAKLTEKAIAALSCGPGQKDRLVFDDALPGLAVRVSGKGTKTFLAQYTIAGQKRRVPLGRWGAITLEQARVAARGVLGDVAQRQDPARERAAARAAAKAEAKASRLTLAALIEQWETLDLSSKREGYRIEATWAVRVAYAEHLSRPASALTRAAALGVLDAIAKSGRRAMAGRTLAYARACYTWAKRRDMVSENPFVDLPISTGTVSRDRVLADDEVAAIWQASAGLGWPFGPLLRVLLLTAQRRSEVGEMRWSELSADRTTWTIPKERSKNGRAHLVHLAPAVRDILAELPRLTGPDGKPSDLVFTTNGRMPISGFSKAKRDLSDLIATNQAKTAGVAEPIAAEVLDGHRLEPWRLHDFRRTAVTWMAGNGVAPHVADRILNHVQGTISGVAAVYQRGEFLAERRAALEAWAGWVTA